MKLVLFVALVAPSLFACSIANDNSADLGNSTTTSFTTGNYVLGGSNTALIVALTGDTSADDITGVSWSLGGSATLVAKSQGTRFHYMYRLLNATAGTGTLTITASTSHILIVVVASYSCVNSIDNSTTGTSASSPFSMTLTPANNNDWVIATAWAFSTDTVGTNTTKRILDAAFSSDGIWESSLNPISPASSTTLSVNYSAAQTASFVIASLSPVTAGGAAPASSKSKKLMKLDASNMPSVCSGMAMPTISDCDGFTSGTMVSFACLYADGSCGAATIPVNLLGGLFGSNPQALTASGAVDMGQHACLVGANLGPTPIDMGSLGSIDSESLAFNCTP